MAKKEAKVWVRVPKDPLNPKDLIKRVIINGKFYDIERGKDVEVPVEVRDILNQNGELG